MKPSCIICSAPALDMMEEYSKFKRVTSDSKPWPEGGELGICPSCGVLQKPVNEAWLQQIHTIYHNYEVYHQAEGQEQAVFNTQTGVGTKRSIVIANFIQQSDCLKAAQGNVLDIGCANGEFLSTFQSAYPNYHLYGHDLDTRYLSRLQTIPHFKQLYQLGETPTEKFDLITLIHTLEHITSPLEMLRSIRGWLTQKGLLFIEVPNLLKNPFDLLIADHCLHLLPDTLRDLLNQAGYQVVSLSTDAVKREISLLATPSDCVLKHQNSFAAKQTAIQRDHLHFLQEILDDAQELAQKGSFGIFGTANSAAWLYSYFPEHIDFFVDEDVARVGRKRFGKPILAPSQLNHSHTVYVPLAPELASTIQERCIKYGAQIYIPRSCCLPL